jgi:hypothetical protein
MGNPLGPSLANVFLCFHEAKWLQDCPTEFKPKFYRRYVDDTFLVFDDMSHVSRFLAYLNLKHPNIKFTSEVEVNGQISFLDVLINKKESSLETSVYRKETFTGLGMKFDSFVPFCYKINLISCMLTRAFRICSDIICFESELNFLKNYFLQNKFPLKIIESSFCKTLDKIYNGNPNDLTVDHKKLYVSLPYFGLDSYKIKKRINSLIREFYPKISPRVILRTNLTLASKFKFKDTLPPTLVSSVIYKYQCGQCTASYIGETRKQLKVRMCQHKGISFRTGNMVASTNSKIFDHFLEYSHSIKDNNFKIISKCPSNDLKILESILIHKSKPTLNEHGSSADLFILN